MTAVRGDRSRNTTGYNPRSKIIEGGTWTRTDLYVIDLAACSERRGVGTPITLMPNADKRKVIDNCAVQVRGIADILFADSA